MASYNLLTGCVFRPSLHHTHLSSIFLFNPSSFVIAVLQLLDSCSLVVRFAPALRYLDAPASNPHYQPST
jgi:hypothetical protein